MSVPINMPLLPKYIVRFLIVLLSKLIMKLTYCTFEWCYNVLHQVSHNIQSAHACWCNKKVIEWLCVKLVEHLPVHTHKPYNYLRNRSAPTVNYWVIIHCLEVSCKEDQITSAQREWFIFVQLTDKQWIITQQFTHWSRSISILTHNKRRKHIRSLQLLPTFRHCTEELPPILRLRRIRLHVIIIPTECFYRFFGDFDSSVGKIKLFLHFDKKPCVVIFDNCLDFTVLDCVDNNELYR